MFRVLNHKKMNDIVDKEIYIEILRILAVLFVIFNHTDGYYLYYSNTDNPVTWWFSFLGSVLCRVNVPLFIMITGTLLLGKKEKMQILFKKRILRIVVTLIVFSFFYYILNIYKDEGISFSISEFLRDLLSGSIQDSFWYLYLYLGLLLMLPFLRKMVISCGNRELQYFLLLQFVLETGGGVFSFLTDIEINENLYVVNTYVFYLLAGYYLGRRVDVGRKEKRWGFISGAVIIFCLVGTFLFAKLDLWRKGVYNQSVLDLLAAILSMSIFINIRWFCQRYDIFPQIKGMIYELGSCVFGIYLLEQLARMQLLPFYLFLSENTFGILACFSYVIGSFFLAWLYTEALQHTPIVKKIL